MIDHAHTTFTDTFLSIQIAYEWTLKLHTVLIAVWILL
jgi:hypothetical protein